MTANSLREYFQERFPLPKVLFVAVSFALLAISPTENSSARNWAFRFTMLMVLFAALLLRQRVTDEFRDVEHDAQNYPGRPYQRGLINKSNLLVLLGIALLVELLAACLLSGVHHFGWYLLVIAYSLLMAKEFFAKKWFEAHFTSYFLAHELIFVLIAGWIAIVMGLPATTATFSWMVAFVSIMMSIEIARKFEIRRNTKGKEVQDTYTSVWGEAATRSAIELLILTSGIAYAFAEHSIGFALIAASVSLALNLRRPRTSELQLIVGSYVLVAGIMGVLL